MASTTSISPAPVIVVLGTGGTIAGLADAAVPMHGYQAARLGVDEILASAPGPADCRLETHQLAQIDSKDMSHALWWRLGAAVSHHLARAEVRGVLITHGTDTLEETAYFLQKTLAPAKPVVMTAAMRPADDLLSDGPRNLHDSLSLLADTDASGVLVVMAGQVWSGLEVRKAHPQSLQAFHGGDAGPLAGWHAGALRQWRAWPAQRPVDAGLWAAEDETEEVVNTWPWVEIVLSYAGARSAAVQAWVAAGVQGLVVAGTGNGTVHEALEPALHDARARGVAIRLASRCLDGALWAPPAGAGDEPSAGWPVYDGLTPVQARIELMLELLAASRQGG